MLFGLQYNEGDMWGLGSVVSRTLPALTVLKLREKMPWLHQYSLEIEQHHNYQGPVVSVICMNVLIPVTTLGSRDGLKGFTFYRIQVELWTLILTKSPRNCEF